MQRLAIQLTKMTIVGLGLKIDSRKQSACLYSQITCPISLRFGLLSKPTVSPVYMFQQAKWEYFRIWKNYRTPVFNAIRLNTLNDPLAYYIISTQKWQTCHWIKYT